MQVQSLFITATGTNIGKTHTTVQLVEAFASKGLSVGVFKPIETGVNTLPADASLLLKVCQKVNKNFLDLTPEDITAYTFPLPAAPFCADTEQIIDLNRIMEKYNELRQLCDILLVEGAGGLMVPVTKEYMMINLAKDLNAKVLLVTPSKLGCINDTLLSMSALRTYDLEFDWCVNLFEDKESFAEVTQPFYDAVFPDWWSVQDQLERYTTLIVDKK
ncbi:dethiobiotin synthase [Sulfurovum sp. XTW-4]|uniref:ATP-dependent dethiobiotin synthetase BioD n=1 Tax=Sulfurovum xiamenensis TaxID=3019066 RepID=A0ABT7QPL2_9BACT|nr:dethiobiotin synthase [Sulfurovum xiamenensis]MDM5263022.1 dethiobiotin synthase [Sulfurovum xiamenensis]